MCNINNEDQYSEEFDQWCKYYDPENKEIEYLLNFDLLHGKSILEVGCGTGRLTFQIASYCKNCIGIDIDERVVQFAIKEKKKSNVQNIDFKVDHAETLSFENETFDLVIFAWSFCCVENKIKALREALRVLKPKGKLILLEPDEGSDYSTIVTEFLPAGYPRINIKEDYELPLVDVFGEIKKKTPPLKIPYVFPNIESAFSVFKFALEDWHKIKTNENTNNELNENLNKYNVNGKIIINEIITLYMCLKG